MTKQLLIESIEENSSGSAFAQQNLLALEVLSKNNCVVPILKVARAGATTSLIAELANSHKRTVIFEPTNKIRESTIPEAIRISNNKDAKLLEILENSKTCKRLQTECEDNPKLKKAKFLLRPQKCEKCSFFDDPSCELQRILNCSDWDILTLTYQKLRALLLSSEYSEVSQMILEKIFSADVAIFDEYTVAMLGLTPSVEISEHKLTSLTNIILDDNDNWWLNTTEVAMAAQEFGSQLKYGSGARFLNPLSGERLEKMKTHFVGAWNKVKGLIAKGVETQYLQDILQMAIYEDLYINKDRTEHISLTPIEQLGKELSFINAFADQFTQQGKLSILVDAHMPEFELQSHFQSKVEPFLWGDPCNTNKKTVYFCDSRKISQADVFHEKTRNYLIDCINQICALNKEVRPLVLCINKSVAKEVERWQKNGLIPDVKVTWYRSVDTRGVQAKGNVEIAIGAPYIPIASYFHKIAKENVNDAIAWSKAFRKTNIDAEWSNSTARVKDPRGVYQSYVYCLGVTKIEVMSLLNVHGQLYASGKVKKPDVIGLTKTDLNPNEWVDMTNLYQRKTEIVDPEKHLPYILELRKLWRINKDKPNADFIPL